jgi:hypothetical protein
MKVGIYDRRKKRISEVIVIKNSFENKIAKPKPSKDNIFNKKQIYSNFDI